MIKEFIKKNKLQNFRIKQFNEQFYSGLINSFDELFTWPKDLRYKLKNEVSFSSLKLKKQLLSKRGDTIKYLFETNSGKLIETVLMMHKDGRNTVCVSVMMGCPVGCRFCATGRMGFKGNLSCEEIVDQVLFVRRYLRPLGRDISNVVYMGMGEPLLNLKEVTESLNILNDPEKIGLGTRKVTISTSGYINELISLIKSGFRGRLAVSLHAPNQKLREKLMPVARTNNLDNLLNVLDDYVQLTKKRITYEYILIDGITDTKDCAKELVNMFRKRLAHINLIPYNKVDGVNFKQSKTDTITWFKNKLTNSGISATVRITMGADVEAACGQLASKS